METPKQDKPDTTSTDSVWNFTAITAYAITAVIVLCMITMMAGYFDAGFGAAALMGIQNLAASFIRRDEARQKINNPNPPTP